MHNCLALNRYPTMNAVFCTTLLEIVLNDRSQFVVCTDAEAALLLFPTQVANMFFPQSPSRVIFNYFTSPYPFRCVFPSFLAVAFSFLLMVDGFLF